jgi:hypothetical protein
MAMTLAQVRTEVRAVLNEPTAAFWSDTEIDNWLKQASILLSSTGCVETTATVALSASTIEYAAPTTFANPNPTSSGLIAISSASLNDISLVKVQHKQFGHITADVTGNTPRYWAHFGQRVFFYPVGSGASGTIDLLCHVESDDVTDIPDAWQPLAIAYAAGKAKQKDGRFLEAQTLFAEVRQILVFLRNDLLERGVDSKQSMTIPTRVERV